jgi:hypothetical protein
MVREGEEGTRVVVDSRDTNDETTSSLTEIGGRDIKDMDSIGEYDGFVEEL